DEAVPARAGVLEDEADVFEYGEDLRVEVGRDLLRPALARTDSGQEEEISDALRVRERAHRLRRARADGILASPAHVFTHTFLGSVKKRKESSPPSRPTPDPLTPPNGTRRSRTIQQLIHTVPASMRSATRCARARFCVHTEADSP